MPFVYNNKVYKLVDRNEDPLEFFVVRKLRVEYPSSQKLTIDLLKSEFRKFGALEKVEIFKMAQCGVRFAHITFKQDTAAYLAMLDMKKEGNSIEIDPVNTSLQPDNGFTDSQSPFQNLLEDCLVKIFKMCDLAQQAILSGVCQKFSDILKENFFGRVKDFDMVGAASELEGKVVTAINIITCVNRKHFNLHILRNPQSGCFDDFGISIQFDSAEGFLQIALEYMPIFHGHLVPALGPYIQKLMVVDSMFSTFAEGVEIRLPNLKEFHLFGSTHQRPFQKFIFKDCSSLTTTIFQNGRFGATEISEYWAQANSIRGIILKKCSNDANMFMSTRVNELNEIVPEGSTVLISWDEIISSKMYDEYVYLNSLLTTMKTPGAYRVFLDIGECTYLMKS